MRGRVQTGWRVTVVAATLFAVLGCGAADRRAQDLYTTAELEERQFNHAHARELYDAVVHDFPDSPWAARARERLIVMGAPPGSAPTAP